MDTRENIYNRLKKEIIYGKIRPGQRLLESELTQYFNCSRTPVREALRQLQSEKYIDFVSNRGATVARLSIREMEELYDVRAVLESHAVEQAAKKIKSTDLKRIIRIQERLRKNASEDDYLGYIQNNFEFHLLFPKISENKILFHLISDLMGRFNTYQYRITSMPSSLGIWLESHQKIIEGLINNNSKGAANSMRSHIEYSKKIAIDFFRKYPSI